MEDDRVAILEAQLAQAKLIAEEADKKYEEVGREHQLRWWEGWVHAICAHFRNGDVLSETTLCL